MHPTDLLRSSTSSLGASDVAASPSMLSPATGHNLYAELTPFSARELETIFSEFFQTWLDCLERGCQSRQTEFLCTPNFFAMTINLTQLLIKLGLTDTNQKLGDMQSIRNYYLKKIQEFFRLSAGRGEGGWCHRIFSSAIFQMLRRVITRLATESDIQEAFKIKHEDSVGQFQSLALSLVFQFFEALAEILATLIVETDKEEDLKKLLDFNVNTDLAYITDYHGYRSYQFWRKPNVDLSYGLDQKTNRAIQKSINQLGLSFYLVPPHQQVLLPDGGLSLEVVGRFIGRSPFLFPTFLDS